MGAWEGGSIGGWGHGRVGGSIGGWEHRGGGGWEHGV